MTIPADPRAVLRGVLRPMAFMMAVSGCGDGATVATDPVASCDATAPPARGPPPAEMAQVATLSPLPELPPDYTNRYGDDPRAAALGQQLFFDFPR
jgi:hypothetical protein